MPANVSIEYVKAEKRYREAKTLEEKLSALREMKKTMPKHKGAENLRAEISKKIKLLSKLLRKREEQRKRSAGYTFSVKKDGIGQIVLLGTPNSGKSFFLNKLTNSGIRTASYPFSTIKPEVAMMEFEKANIQLVELPAIIRGSSQGKAMGNEILSIARNSDALILFVDNKEFEKKTRILLTELKSAGISIGEKNKGVTGSSCKKALIIVNNVNGEKIGFPKQLSFIPVIVWQETKEDILKKKIFELLDLILVYTKKPREKIAENPLPVRKGATVFEVAVQVHKDFKNSFKYAKIWGSGRFPGQRVAKNYEVKHNDVIEIYS